MVLIITVVFVKGLTMNMPFCKCLFEGSCDKKMVIPGFSVIVNMKL